MAVSSKDSVVVVDPDILGGEYAVFRGTRVPVQNLFNYFKKGYSLDEFLLDFPTVTREQVEVVLDVADEFIEARLASWKLFWMSASRSGSGSSLPNTSV